MVKFCKPVTAFAHGSPARAGVTKNCANGYKTAIIKGKIMRTAPKTTFLNSIIAAFALGATFGYRDSSRDRRYK